jgi:hypothetical protein
LRAVVEGRWQRADSEVPSSARGYLADMARQGAASDDLDGFPLGGTP